MAGVVARAQRGCNTEELEDVSEAGAPEPITVRLDWSEATAIPVRHANQALYDAAVSAAREPTTVPSGQEG
jgi:hypothetical protein